MDVHPSAPGLLKPSRGNSGPLVEESKPQLRTSDLSPPGARLDTKPELPESRLSFYQQAALNPASVMHHIKKNLCSSTKEGRSTAANCNASTASDGDLDS